jgi:hypothetical protein
MGLTDSVQDEVAFSERYSAKAKSGRDLSRDRLH